jgi:hypothetical protein
MAATLGGGTVVALSGIPGVGTSPLEQARELRVTASKACAVRQWRECLDALDEAKKLDPDGDQTDAIREERSIANFALGLGDAGR